MTLFQEWMRKREWRESENPADSFRFNSDEEDYAIDNERIENELFKTVLSKYPNETMGFLDSLAQQDQEIAGLLSKMSRQPSQATEPKHSSMDDNEVVPPGADRGYNSEFGGDD